jgi:hypothetical protein
LLFLSQPFEDRYFRKFEISRAIFSASCVLTRSVESKPNSKISKTKMIGVMLIAFRVTGKKSPQRGGRAEHRATDLRLRTRMKRSSLIPVQLSLSSRYFLKRLKTDISQTVKSFAGWIDRVARAVCDCRGRIIVFSEMR